jgi:hypothetical protein
MTGSARQAGQPSPVPQGLCASCRHGQRITNRAGSVFLLCQRSRTQPEYPRYPPLPVLACRGYDARDVDPAAPQ